MQRPQGFAVAVHGRGAACSQQLLHQLAVLLLLQCLRMGMGSTVIIYPVLIMGICIVFGWDTQMRSSKYNLSFPLGPCFASKMLVFCHLPIDQGVKEAQVTL